MTRKQRQKLVTVLAPVAVLLTSAATAEAATTYVAVLTNAQEGAIVPTTTTGQPRSSSGTATFVLNDAQTAFSMVVDVTGIDVNGSQSSDTNDNLVNAHIHAGPNNPPNTNPVVWGFFGAPNNNTNNDIVLTPTASPGVGGHFTMTWDAAEGNSTTLAAQLPAINAGRAYINFHTVQFGGGEIRGAILPIPEPSTAALLGTGFIALTRLQRRKSD
jgi:hypothetical protein